jgi:hypothetical protein
MSYYKDKIIEERQRLAGAVSLVNDLLDELNGDLDKAVANGVEAYRLKKSKERIAQIEQLVSVLVDYDAMVVQYIQFNPEGTPYYKERLAIAKRYVTSLGGDWSTVLWGKVTDYPY